MTPREGALLSLHSSLRLAEKDGGPCEMPRWRMAEIIAALSACACGGRPSLGTIGALVRIRQPQPKKIEAYANMYTSQIGLFPAESVKDGEWVDVLVFARGALPAEEEKA